MKCNSILILAAGLVLAGVILNGRVSSLEKASPSAVTPPANGVTDLLADDNTQGQTQSLGLLADDNTQGQTQSLGLLADDNTQGQTQSLGLLADDNTQGQTQSLGLLAANK